MTNIKITKVRGAGRNLFPIVGIALLLSTTAFSQTNSIDGIDDASKQESLVKRDPFWPIDYVPEIVKTAEAKKTVVKKRTEGHDWNGAMKKVVINGVSSRADNEFFAVINGEVKSVNDTISINHGDITYTWAVSSIKPPGSVKLRRVSAL